MIASDTFFFFLLVTEAECFYNVAESADISKRKYPIGLIFATKKYKTDAGFSIIQD